MTISHEEYGAKAANLARIDPLMTALEDSNQYGLLAVPEFEAVSGHLYERWLNHDLTGAELLELYKHAKRLSEGNDGVMVRSSAVLGEDGEKAMGAGIYDSLMLRPGFTSLEFYAAIISVYKSAKSPKATAYLEQLGISPDDERMGLVLQAYPKELRTHFTLDTEMVGAASLVSVRTGDLVFEPLVQRPRVGQAVLSKEALRTYAGDDEDTLHLVPDFRKLDRNDVSDAVKLGRVSLAIEDLIGTAVQIEAVTADVEVDIQEAFWARYQEANPISHGTAEEEHIAYRERQRATPDTRTKLWVVQSRPLSYKTEEVESFTGFPKAHANLAYIGRSLGVLNGVSVSALFRSSPRDTLTDTEVKEMKRSAEDEKYLIVFGQSFATGNATDDFSHAILQLPYEVRKKIVILVEHPSHQDAGMSSGGHIETMCLELGIPCIFYGQTESKVSDEDLYPRTSMRLGDKFKVYSNGVEARIYRV